MKPKILFIGSIGAIAETSELQRQAYNEALKENGVSWEWSPEVYRELLKSNGGQDRLELLSKATGQHLSDAQIKKIHALKTQLAGKKIAEEQIAPRPGVKEMIAGAKADGTKVAWVTTTGEANTDAILSAFNEELGKDDFDHIFHRDDAENGKPSPDIYRTALDHFGVAPQECIAIEDSLNSALAAKRAGIFSVVTLGAYHDEDLTGVADVVLDGLDKADWKNLKNSFADA